MPAPIPPTRTSCVKTSSIVFALDAAPTAQTRLTVSGLPSQPNCRGSNLILGRLSTACDGRLREKLPKTVPSFGATVNRWLVAVMVPAPGMFCTTMPGRPGM